MLKDPIPSPVSQLELPIARPPMPDRNAANGGRSFYFFDFDDNVMRLDTTIYIFSRTTNEEMALSTRRFAEAHPLLGKPGRYQDFEVRLDDATGSYRRFRDLGGAELDGKRQPFVEDLAKALDKGDVLWKGPSWSFFYHAVFNGRPVAVITARGHAPETLASGIDLLRERGLLAAAPNYLGLYPVSHPGVRAKLGDAATDRSIPELKRRAIIDAVRIAMQRYGENPYHRFGMSDDDPRNVALAVAAMTELKARYPENAFFVINTSSEPAHKTEILVDRTATEALPFAAQLKLFDE